MANILGVSIGTRNVGVAVIRLKILTDYRIRTFAGKWTPRKCQSILDILETIIIRNGITGITIKIPDTAHRSIGMDDLIKEITKLTDTYKITLHHCSIQDIKLCFTNEMKCNKKIMVAALIDKYPELKKEWNNGKRAQVYNAKLFEAIACAELALRAGH